MENVKITKETIVRGILYLIALINNILTVKGLPSIKIGSEEITLLVSTAIMLWGFWKNNSFTKDAIKADIYLKDLRSKSE